MSKNIKIITNYINEDLYLISKSFYNELEFDKIGIKGLNNFYSFKFLNDIIINEKYKDVDIMIYIDEDCFIINNGALLDLLDYFIIKDIDCVGMPDGGVIKNRSHNPVAINQFFCILNLKKIRYKYVEDVVVNTKYSNNLNKFIPYCLLKENNVNYDDFEPYYKIFFWMLNNGYKIEYLDAYSYIDNTTTILKNHIGVDFAYHSWYARKWIDEYQNKRIKKIINYCSTIKK